MLMVCFTASPRYLSKLRCYHHNCIGRASNRRKRLLIPPPPLFHFSYGQGGNRTPIPFRATVFETVAIPLCDPSKNVEEQTQPTGLCLWSTTQAGEHPLEYCCSSVRSLTSRFSSHAYQNKDFRSQRPLWNDGVYGYPFEKTTNDKHERGTQSSPDIFYEANGTRTRDLFRDREVL